MSPRVRWLKKLIINGKVDVVKVGIGPGSACLTRLKTGVGVPQLSAIIECSDAAHGVGGYIIGDGGITCPGDNVESILRRRRFYHGWRTICRTRRNTRGNNRREW